MRKLLLIFISFIVVFPVLAQEENLYQIVTPYEKARESASEIWLKDYIDNAAQQDLELFVVGLGLSASGGIGNDIENLETVESTICLLCGLPATSPASSWADYLLQQKLSPICEKYAKHIAEAQKLKSDSDKTREKKRADDKLHSNLPIKLLSKECNRAYAEWATKGEFEKIIDWNNRIKSKSNAIFDSICSEKYITAWALGSGDIHCKLNNYDAEAESFSLTLLHSYENKESHKNEVVSSLTGYCVVKNNPQRAKQFLTNHLEGETMTIRSFFYNIAVQREFSKFCVRHICWLKVQRWTFSQQIYDFI